MIEVTSKFKNAEYKTNSGLQIELDSSVFNEHNTTDFNKDSELLIGGMRYVIIDYSFSPNGNPVFRVKGFSAAVPRLNALKHD